MMQPVLQDNPPKERDPMENKQTFGAFILRRRKELGMTQKEFAEKADINAGVYSRYERGETDIPLSVAPSACEKDVVFFQCVPPFIHQLFE